MSKLSFQNLRHAYAPDPRSPADYALAETNMEFADGGAYALLGPSGCGKTTLLNILSGLVTPSEGRVLPVSGRLRAHERAREHCIPASQSRREGTGA